MEFAVRVAVFTVHLGLACQLSLAQTASTSRSPLPSSFLTDTLTSPKVSTPALASYNSGHH
jgi:hypothetical protein